MKRTVFILSAMLAGLMPPSLSPAQERGHITPGVAVDSVSLQRNGKFLTAEMAIDLTGLSVGSNRATLLTPRLVNGADSVDLPSIGIYGRRRYYYYVRNGISSLSGSRETVCRARRKPGRIGYRQSVDYEDWMDGATLKFHHSDWGCCQEQLAEYEGTLAAYKGEPEKFFPLLVFETPRADTTKTRSLSGSAFIDFRVDKTDIDPAYRRNTAELARIDGTIDSVRQDKDITIRRVWLKGYASPESPYAHNRDLARGRTRALKKHLLNLFDFDERVIATDFEPEDWAGLRRYVKDSNLEHRDAILALIDADMDPDAKEDRIRRAYPGDYAFLKEFCYPALRHTDYRIDYTIRVFTDLEEIRRVMREEPQKLSLNEFYLVANACEEGTPEFTEVFETAVRLFPADTVANLNAANAALRLDNLPAARRYLQKAGSSAKAVYARAALAIRGKDYARAAALLKEARGMGLEQAAQTLEEMKEKGLYTEE